MRYAIPALLAAALLTGTEAAMACDSLGENMHMGQIVSIDRKDSSFVIRDAETGKPVRFSASQAALVAFDVNDMVEVSYEVLEGGALRTLKLNRL
jgi:hypothetical protein